MMNREVIGAVNCVNPEKFKDIQKPLKKHYGGGWETDSSLQFYNIVISDSQPGNCSNQEEESLCCPIIDSEELVV
jgi:hypothetical protein